MMKTTLVFLLSVLLLHLGQTDVETEQKPQKVKFPQYHPPPPPPVEVHPEQKKHNGEILPSPPVDGAVVPPDPAPQLVPVSPQHTPLGRSLLSEDCVLQKYTRLSCAKVFCLPWQRCINGNCVCKLPYQCPRIGPSVCGLDGRNILSLCQAQAISCRDKKAVFSHYREQGDCDEPPFSMHLKEIKGQEVVMVDTILGEKMICGSDLWNMAAANVVCRKQDARGARQVGTIKFQDVAGEFHRKAECMSVRCSGAEKTLAECVLYKPQVISPDTSIATVKCYTQQDENKKCDEFHCVNSKCVSWDDICDGVDNCGDNSDEMCCTGCQKDAFYCNTGVCVPRSAVGDQIRDCLGGEDEVTTSNTPHTSENHTESHSRQTVRKEIWSNPKEDIQKARNYTETLQCGIPNMDYLHKTEEETRYKRTKRVVGGEEARPTQIQWQVAIQEEGKIHCGGAYLGGCWVLTAAHCVRPKPQVFRIKFSLWKKVSLLSTTDIVPVKNIIIHRDYNPRTYENDIALIQLEELAHVKECLNPNPAVRPVCVPWSSLQFPPNHTCTISGWGRNKDGGSVNTLKWANVSLIPQCRTYYKERFFDGMMCAGDLEGKVDSCQGDSGGPLVCTDASGVSYVWGIVSWGEKCGERGFPGVYTQVSHYFEWIRQHTGWPAVTKYNH